MKDQSIPSNNQGLLYVFLIIPISIVDWSVLKSQEAPRAGDIAREWYGCFAGRWFECSVVIRVAKNRGNSGYECIAEVSDQETGSI